MRADKHLPLNWKRALLIIGAFILAIILHNAVYALFKGHFDSLGQGEGSFMALALFVILPYGLISPIYAIIRLLTRSKS